MKKKQKIFTLFCFLFLLIIFPLFAHSPLLIIEDNDEEFVYVKAGFSNGQAASGMSLYVKSKFDNRVIETLKFPETSQLKIKIPDEPYYLVFDGGPGHKVAKNGPPPEAGFSIHAEAINNKIPGQGIPLWMIMVGIAAIITIVVFAAPKLFKQK